jgi:methylmalonyl-CoA mutase C-terminal domain/subunit
MSIAARVRDSEEHDVPSAGKRILIAKMGLDGHDTDIITVARTLREAGYEVIYLGLHSDAGYVVKAAVEEGVDAIGVSFLPDEHLTQMRKLLARMNEAGLDVPVLYSGAIPADDTAELREMGVVVVVPGALAADFPAVLERLLAGRAA